MTYNDIRELLVRANDDLRTRFLAGESVIDLVHARAAQIDDVLVGLPHYAILRPRTGPDA